MPIHYNHDQNTDDGSELATLDCAWRAFDADSSNREAKGLIAHRLRDDVDALAPEFVPLFLRLVRDRDVEPDALSPAGWHYLQRGSDVFGRSDLHSAAQWLEGNELGKTLLSEAPVTNFAVENQLTRLRRWLLLSDKWQDFPRLTEAMRAQAALNGGAWLIAAEERAWLDSRCEGNTTLAYGFSTPASSSRPDLSDAVTRAVAEQYENWPYPQWTRVLASPPRSFRDFIQKLDPDGPDMMSAAPEILIAGCGTGKHLARWAIRYPNARFTAIDVSRASLRYAEARCAELGLQCIEFRELDLHRVADLKRRFDAISCTGVLHSLPEPEKGWVVLVEALKPNGAMQVSVYSSVARLAVRAMRTMLSDLTNKTVTSDLLREVRRRVIERFAERILTSVDFYTLAGVCDLLVPSHEDPFDVPRIKRAIDRFGLRLLRFRLRDRVNRCRYLQEYPHDPLFCDVDAWTVFEKQHPTFSGMYSFWCRRVP